MDLHAHSTPWPLPHRRATHAPSSAPVPASSATQVNGRPRPGPPRALLLPSPSHPTQLTLSLTESPAWGELDTACAGPTRGETVLTRQGGWCRGSGIWGCPSDPWSPPPPSPNAWGSPATASVCNGPTSPAPGGETTPSFWEPCVPGAQLGGLQGPRTWNPFDAVLAQAPCGFANHGEGKSGALGWGEGSAGRPYSGRRERGRLRPWGRPGHCPPLRQEETPQLGPQGPKSGCQGL